MIPQTPACLERLSTRLAVEVFLLLIKVHVGHKLVATWERESVQFAVRSHLDMVSIGKESVSAIDAGRSCPFATDEQTYREK
jgi:hypothetical protein